MSLKTLIEHVLSRKICAADAAHFARERVHQRPHEEEDDVNGEKAGDGRPQLPGNHLRLQEREERERERMIRS